MTNLNLMLVLTQRVFIVLLFSISFHTFAQETSISYNFNGKISTLEAENPFAKFIGEWTLKNDDWSQNWGGETENIKIPKHHTISAGINTKNSLISIIDGPDPNGQIFWSYNPNTKEVHHLSSFGDIRAGQGKGTIDANGNIALKLVFEGEPEGTYRKYNYTWLNNNEYELKSVQFDANDNPTGLFYGGSFVRINTDKNIRTAINNVLKVLDDNEASMETKLSVYTNDIVHMAPNNETITNKEELKKYLEKQNTYGYSNMTHEILDFEIINDIIIMRGQVVGRFYPSDGKKPIDFRTKNLFVFKWENDALKISKIIYNISPVTQN